MSPAAQVANKGTASLCAARRLLRTSDRWSSSGFTPGILDSISAQRTLEYRVREVNSPIEALFNGRYRGSSLRHRFQRSLLVQKYLLGWDEIFTATWRARVCLSLEA